MTRAEEAAMKAYPPTYTTVERHAKRVQSELVDTHKPVRAIFQQGYEQAEKDLALTWQDIRRIVKIADDLLDDPKAKETLSLDEFKRTMSGIYSTTVGKGTIDESPMAYKPMDEIIRCIEPTAKVSEIIKPVYNFKAGE